MRLNELTIVSGRLESCETRSARSLALRKGEPSASREPLETTDSRCWRVLDNISTQTDTVICILVD